MRLIMISGPIASGKSTVGAELTRRLRGRGLSVALTDLDTVAEMALPTLSDWEWAHKVHALVVAGWLGTDVDVVVDEGTSRPAEVHQVLDLAPPGTEVFHVVLLADFARSLARAQADPSRGMSKDPDFLRADHDGFLQHLPDLPCDLQLDVEVADPQHLVSQVLAALP